MSGRPLRPAIETPRVLVHQPDRQGAARSALAVFLLLSPNPLYNRRVMDLDLIKKTLTYALWPEPSLPLGSRSFNRPTVVTRALRLLS